MTTDLITGAAAARILDISRPAVSQLAASGKLPSTRLPGGPAFKLEHVLEYREERRKARLRRLGALVP